MSTRATGPIDFENDSEATILRKAGEGALTYTLRNAGWAEEQIENGMATYYRSVAHELAESIRQEIERLRADGVLEDGGDWAASDAADLIDPEVAKP